MYYVYFLKSKIKDVFYIGVTSNLRERLESHNSGKGNFTRKYKPWELKYSEEYIDKKAAYKREWFLKHPAGYNEKLEIVNKINGQVNSESGLV